MATQFSTDVVAELEGLAGHEGRSALRVAFMVECYPIAVAQESVPDTVRLLILTAEVCAAKTGIHDWLRLEFGLNRPGRELETPERLDAERFAAAVRAALPRRRHLSAAEVARLKREHAETIIPARQAAAEGQRLERRLPDSSIRLTACPRRTWR